MFFLMTFFAEGNTVISNISQFNVSGEMFYMMRMQFNSITVSATNTTFLTGIVVALENRLSPNFVFFCLSCFFIFVCFTNMTSPFFQVRFDASVFSDFVWNRFTSARRRAKRIFTSSVRSIFFSGISAYNARLLNTCARRTYSIVTDFKEFVFTYFACFSAQNTCFFFHPARYTFIGFSLIIIMRNCRCLFSTNYTRFTAFFDTILAYTATIFRAAYNTVHSWSIFIHTRIIPLFFCILIHKANELS